MDHLSFEEVNDLPDALVQIGRALRNALRTRYTVAITPEAWEAIYWTMVSVGTSVSVGAAIVLHEVSGPDTKV